MKILMMNARAVSLLVVSMTFLAVSLGCTHASSGSLAGTYWIEEHGKRKEFLRVQERAGQYFISEKHGEEWGREDKLQPIPPQDYEKLLGPDWKDAQPSGLQHDGFAILKVNPGLKMKGFRFECKTGYMAFVMIIGPIELHKE